LIVLKIFSNDFFFLHKAVKSYGKKNFLGTLNNGEYVYKTFSDVENLARWVGSGIENRNLAPEIQEYK
jgi:hypothetical protein